MNRFKLALEVQDACNITAVAALFHSVCQEVLHETRDTAAVAKDPAVLWILDKMNDLTGRPETVEMDRAYLICHERSQGEKVNG